MERASPPRGSVSIPRDLQPAAAGDAEVGSRDTLPSSTPSSAGSPTPAPSCRSPAATSDRRSSRGARPYLRGRCSKTCAPAPWPSLELPAMPRNGNAAKAAPSGGVRPHLRLLRAGERRGVGPAPARCRATSQLHHPGHRRDRRRCSTRTISRASRSAPAPPGAGANLGRRWCRRTGSGCRMAPASF